MCKCASCKNYIPVQPKSKPTAIELMVLEFLSPEIKYIARDKDGELYGYTTKPQRELVAFNSSNYVCFNMSRIFRDGAFSWVQWEDEPVCVADLIS